VWNWSNYVAPETIPNFEREFGAEVRYVTYESNEEMLAKVISGNSGWDVVFPSNYYIGPMAALNLLEVDRFGLDEIDRKIMMTILEKYGGGPVGISTIAASIDEESGTIEEVYEPYLMQLGFLDRTPRGRIATERAYEYFQIPRRGRSMQLPLT